MPSLRRGSSSYHGVRERPSCTSYAEIRSNDMRLGLGTFDTDDEPARAYDAVAWRLNRPRRDMNFLESSTKQSSLSDKEVSGPAYTAPTKFPTPSCRPITNAWASFHHHVAAEQVLPLLLVTVDPAAAAAATYPAGGARLLLTRRAHALSLLAGAASVASVAVAGRARAAAEEDGKGEGVVGAFKSLFDPNEETKAGKVLPKAYLKAAREVVRTLRESLEEGDAAGDSARFRRGADSAKTSIREFLGGWRGQPAVAKEESYVALEKAIKSLAEFYSKAGPFASLPGDVKSKILDDLNAAEAYL
ncbi:photosystem II D1 precursor processing protein PSB27-H2, chloroplastic [Hordeum vulgare]|nr:photosystem II D1 precursor processing protein PSB27-H2, chloroplastic [Hordeum vulgare]